MCDYAMVSESDRLATHQATRVAGMQVSTVLLQQGWYETRLFNDGTVTGGRHSAQLESYGSYAESVSGHRYWSGRPAGELAGLLMSETAS